MNIRILYFVAGMGVFAAVLLSIAAYFLIQRLRRRSRLNQLIGRLATIDRVNVAIIALDLINEDGQAKSPADAGLLEASEIWERLGGLPGLAALEKNSDLLIDLMFHLQEVHPEAIELTDRLRQDARRLKWHIARLRGAAENGHLQVSFGFYAQRAVVSYYLITQRMLILCESGKFPVLADLQRAL